MSEGCMHEADRVALELRDQLASDKRRIAFFMGAGTSMAIGIPGIMELTAQVREQIEEELKPLYDKVRTDVGESASVEPILNRVRLLKELLGADDSRMYEGMTGSEATELETAICRAIKESVCMKVTDDSFPHKVFAQWLRASYACRSSPVELFTVNYDLNFERAMEMVGLPCFDGFIGTVFPFFAPESVDSDIGTEGGICPPRTWTRLWKLHGSVNWYVLRDAEHGTQYVTRLTGESPPVDAELMIYPSREKYNDSRRLPFLAYQDRLRRFLSKGESVLFIIGYSFSDDHINDIIFQGLRGNSRLAVNAIVYGIPETVDGQQRLVLPEKLVEYGQTFRNLSIYGPNKAVIGGVVGEWSMPNSRIRESAVYWSDSDAHFRLGNFADFVSYLERFVGFGANFESLSINAGQDLGMNR